MSEFLIGTDTITGSCNIARLNATTSTNATSVKPGPGNVYGIVVLGAVAPAAAGAAFLKLFDKASAPTLGTDTPVFTIPLISTANFVAEVEVTFPVGIPFKNGIAYAITGAVADSDSTALVASGLVQGFLLWK